MITAITTCVYYDDYLSISLPLNRHLFDDYFIITSNEDNKTQEIAKQNNCKVVVTDAFKYKKASFNKGKAINAALSEISTGWICHIDADIVVDTTIIPTHYDQKTLYGCVRYMCPRITAWKARNIETWETYKGKLFIVDNKKIKQWLPLGFFQLWHSSTNNKYPEHCLTAAVSDVIFSLQWSQRVCLDDIKALHLPVRGTAPEGANWRGRTTKRIFLEDDSHQAS